VTELVGVDRAEWTSRDAGALIAGLDAAASDAAGRRRLRGAIDVRFADVPEDDAWQNPHVCAYLRDLYDRAPWVAYLVVPSPEQKAMFLMAHGAWVTAPGPERRIEYGIETVTALENAVLAAGIYAVEQGDDWRLVVEPWSDGISPDLRETVREVLSGLYDRHAGLRLTSRGWMSNAE